MGIKLDEEQANALDSYISSLPEEKRPSFIEGFKKLPDKGKVGLTGELLSTFKPSNNFAPTPSDQLSIINQRTESVGKKIEERKSIWDNIAEDFSSKSKLRKYGLGTLGVLGAPFKMIEGGIANPALAMQSGQFNPIELTKQFSLGISGQKQGQFGDVYRVAGVPEPLAATSGFVLGASPVKALSMANKAFGSISRFTDKGVIRAGDSLVKATKNAEKFTGEKLDVAFKGVDQVKVDPNTFIDEITKLPKPLINVLEEKFGNLDDVAQNMTVGTLRILKQTIGKYRPSIWGKSERGLQENIDAENINSVYGAIKNLMKGSVTDAVGEKAASKLLSAEESYSKVAKASDYIRKTIMDATLRKPTKSGEMAAKLKVEGDVSGRMALNTIKEAGKQARIEINNAITKLERFNAIQTSAKVAKHIGTALTFGGAIGALGGMAASKIMNKTD